MSETVTIAYHHYTELGQQEKRANELYTALKQTNDLLVRLQGKVSGGYGEVLDGEIMDQIWFNRELLQDETW